MQETCVIECFPSRLDVVPLGHSPRSVFWKGLPAGGVHDRRDREHQHELSG